jgi:hypothetical protein
MRDLRKCSNISQDFNEAKHAKDAVSFFVYTIIWENNVENISIDNVKTKEKLVIKTKAADDDRWKIMLMIARYPLNAAKSWIEANEKEIAEWDGRKLDRKISVVMTQNSS